MTSQFRGFKMAPLNVNSLCRHIDELRAIMTNQPLDILAINESKLGENDYDQLFSLEGCTIVIFDNTELKSVFTTLHESTVTLNLNNYFNV